MPDRICPHASEFECWYRVSGRCCQGAVEDMAGCHGQWPSRSYRPASVAGRIPLPESGGPDVLVGRPG